MNTRLPASIRCSVLLLFFCLLTLPAFWYSHGQDNPHEDKPGLRMRLSEGRPQTEKSAKPAVTPVAEPLSARAMQAVLARLAAIKQAVIDQQPFALRPRSLPLPLRSGGQSTISRARPSANASHWFGSRT
jgi:hypothetical protein